MVEYTSSGGGGTVVMEVKVYICGHSGGGDIK